MEKQITIRELLESKDYLEQKELVQRENDNPLIIDRSVFSKKGTAKEDKDYRDLHVTLRMQWRETIKKLGFTKRTFPRKGLQTLSNG